MGGGLLILCLMVGLLAGAVEIASGEGGGLEKVAFVGR